MNNFCHSFDDIIGHERQIRFLKAKLESDTLSDVILLVGNTGIGKSSIAKVLACEIAYRMNSTAITKEEAIRKIVDEDVSTNEVLLYNMSNLRQDTEINDVRSNLSIGFSTTGRKVLILDEAHGMTLEQQDSLLTSLEHLQTGVYVILCTTDTTGFRDELLGRCKVPLQLNNLSNNEIKTLIKRYITNNDLSFEMNERTFISLISSYTGNEPRRALNLLSNFDPGTHILTRDLEVFINVDEAEQVVQLVKHLYGNVLLGIEYLSDMKTEKTFVTSLIEVTKVALGANSATLKRDSVIMLHELVEEHGVDSLLGFCMEVTATSRLSKSRMIGFFIKWNVESREMLKLRKEPVKAYSEQTIQQDIGIMQQTLQRGDVAVQRTQSVQPVLSLSEMFERAEDME